MSQYCSPLRYPGGKNCIFQFVSNLFYENNLLGVSYAEPYAGGAGLALRLLFEEYVDHIFINDLDRSIFAFWMSVTEKAEEFCSWIVDVDVTMDSWFYYKHIQKADTRNLLELAKSTFFLNRTNISGVIKGGVIGGVAQKGKYKIDARFNKDDLIERIEKISRFKHRITVSNLDGLNFVRKMDKVKKEIFIYLDPPYCQKGADLYMNYFSERDHRKLARHVHKLRKKWMVSYDNNDFILNLYAERRRLLYKLSQSASNRVGDEVLIFSDRISFTDSMNELNTPVLL